MLMRAEAAPAAPMPSITTLQRLAVRAFDVLLVANALDLTTSAIPTYIDERLPARSTAALVVQLLLVAALLWRARRVPGAVVRRLRALPLPRPAALVLLSFVALELVHVALRMEIYPFSPIAMFSSLTRPSSDATYAADVYVQDRDGALEIFSFMREGNPLFARYFDWDYKAAWLMRMNKGNPAVEELLTARLRAEGLPPPSLRHIQVRKRDGAIVRVARLP
jgi:hypothetical protein